MKISYLVAAASLGILVGCGAHNTSPGHGGAGHGSYESGGYESGTSGHEAHGGGAAHNGQSAPMMGEDMHAMHAGHEHMMNQPSAAGEPGKAEDVTQTINVEATDAMMFRHPPFTVKAGETVRFVVTNKGKLSHEFNIGVSAEHMRHQAMMREMPQMKHHGTGGSVTVEPGETREIIWKFAKAGDIQAACNLPGHYEAGMHSQITVE